MLKGRGAFFSPLTGSLNGKNNTDRSCRSSNSEVRCAGQQNDMYFELRSSLCVTADQKNATLVVVNGIATYLSKFMVIGHLWLCEGNAPTVIFYLSKNNSHQTDCKAFERINRQNSTLQASAISSLKQCFNLS